MIGVRPNVLDDLNAPLAAAVVTIGVEQIHETLVGDHAYTWAASLPVTSIAFAEHAARIVNFASRVACDQHQLVKLISRQLLGDRYKLYDEGGPVVPRSFKLRPQEGWGAITGAGLGC